MSYPTEAQVTSGVVFGATDELTGTGADAAALVAAAYAASRVAIVADKANIAKDHAISIAGMTAITGTDRGTLDIAAGDAAAIAAAVTANKAKLSDDTTIEGVTGTLPYNTRVAEATALSAQLHDWKFGPSNRPAP